MVNPIRRIAVLSLCVAVASSLAAAEKPAKKVKTTAKKVEKAEKEDKGTKAGKEAQADADLAALLDKSDSLQYSVERAGGKKAVGTGAIVAKIGDQELKSDLKYEWEAGAKDGKGKYSFSDPSIAGKLKPMGLDAPIDDFFRAESWRQSFAGCRLVGTKDGKKTTVKVEGKSKDGISAFVLGEEGIPESVTRGPLTLAITAIKLGEKFAVSKVAISMNGAPVGTLEYTYVPAGSRHAPGKVVCSFSMGANKAGSTTTFTDWKIEPEGDAGAKAGAKTPKPSATKKSSKPVK
jgi:hypothetical protein